MADLQAIVHRLGGNLYAGGARASIPGPGHNRHDRSLSLWQATPDRVIWFSFAQDPDAEITAYLGLEPGETHRASRAEYDRARAAQQAARQRRENAIAAFCERVWSGCQPVEGSPAERYLDAATQRAEIAERAKYSPLGGLTGAAQEAVQSQKAIQREIADLATLQAAGDRTYAHELEVVSAAVGTESELYKKLTQEKKDADADWANKKLQLLNQLTNQEVQDQQKIAQAWHAVIDPMVQTTGSNILKLAEGTETWNQALLNVGQSALDMIIQQIERMVEAWIVSALTGTAKNAGLAGSAGVASMAGAPFPIDLTAPAFGAEMAAAAGAFGSFAQGVDVVPRDMVAQIHAGERVMSPGDNSALISAMSGRGPGGGDVHNHNTTYAPQISAPPDFGKQLRDHERDIVALIHRAERDGRFRF